MDTTLTVGEFFGGAWTFVVNMPLWAAVLLGVFLCFMLFGFFLMIFDPDG